MGLLGNRWTSLRGYLRFLVLVDLGRIIHICAIPIDNGLATKPGILCGEDRIAVDFRTINEFTGNVYVKGNFLNDGCRTGATGRNQVAIVLPFETMCGLRRRRRASPPGIVIETVIVIMFHSRFLTKVDRAYRIECFYMEADKVVTTGLDVSMIPTVPITASISMPTCVYQVLRGGPLGPAVTFAEIGEPVYHKWTCSGGSVDMFCMTVHSCQVDDGQGESNALLDENGCSLDRYLLLNIEYLSDLVAGREAHVFKFADRPTLYFNCQIRLVLKEGLQCRRSSDNCPQPARVKRDSTNNGTVWIKSRDHQTSSTIVDVTSNMDVLEIQERVKPLDADRWDDPQTVNGLSSGDPGQFCVSSTGAGFLIALISFLCLSILTFVCANVSPRFRQCFCRDKSENFKAASAVR